MTNNERKERLIRQITAIKLKAMVDHDEINGIPIADVMLELLELLSSQDILAWMSAEEGRVNTYQKLYLAYQPGYPLMIADWKSGHGYRDVRTGVSINPTKVGYINGPK